MRLKTAEDGSTLMGTKVAAARKIKGAITVRAAIVEEIYDSSPIVRRMLK
jgi:hypothetical protein